MNKIDKKRISNNTAHNNKEISIPLIWIVFPLIIILLIFIPFKIPAIGTTKFLKSNEIQLESEKKVLMI